MGKLAENNLINLFSESRLSSYRYKDADTSVALERYLYNIELSKAFYPLLSLLEVALRNRLNEAIEATIKQDWLMEELKAQDILLDGEYKKLKDAKEKLKKKRKAISKGRLIAELSLGFWISLCAKKYKANLWHKKNFFRIVFPHYTNQSERDKLSKVFPVLQLFLGLRNRIFHHEIILNHPLGLENCYNELKQLLSYISLDGVEMLDKICIFKELIKKQKP